MRQGGKDTWNGGWFNDFEEEKISFREKILKKQQILSLKKLKK